MSEPEHAIISIRPPYAALILDGSKTVELRRRVPPIAAGTRLWIYATRPIASIIGIAVVKDIERARPEAIWRKHGRATGLDRAAFQNYFNGSPEAVALLLLHAIPVKPISLERLRAALEQFHPPQVLLRVGRTDARVLLQLSSLHANAGSSPKSKIAWRQDFAKWSGSPPSRG